MRRLGIILLVFVLALGTAAVFGMLLLVNTGWFPHQPLVMKLRQYGYLAYRFGWGDLTNAAIKPPFSLFASQKFKNSNTGEPNYIYVLLGKFDSLDVSEKIIYIKDRNNLRLGFNYSKSLTRFDNLIINDYLLGENYEIDEGSGFFSPGDWLLFYWTDPRQYREIMGQAAIDDGYVVNSEDDGDWFEMIYRVKYAD